MKKHEFYKPEEFKNNKRVPLFWKCLFCDKEFHTLEEADKDECLWRQEKEIIKKAMDVIAVRKQGHSRLVYDKTSHTIIAVLNTPLTPDPKDIALKAAYDVFCWYYIFGKDSPKAKELLADLGNKLEVIGFTFKKVKK